MRDEVMDLYHQGRTYADIARLTGRTRGSVSSHIRRNRVGLPTGPKYKTPDARLIEAAIKRHGGNLSKVARDVGVAMSTLRRYGYRSSFRRHGNLNQATDPDTRALIDEINISPMSDFEISIKVDMGFNNISRWRRGKSRANPFLAQCVRTVLERQNTPGY